jgi:hypothetical protein
MSTPKHDFRASYFDTTPPILKRRNARVQRCAQAKSESSSALRSGASARDAAQRSSSAAARHAAHYAIITVPDAIFRHYRHADILFSFAMFDFSPCRFTRYCHAFSPRRCHDIASDARRHEFRRPP